MLTLARNNRHFTIAMLVYLLLGAVVIWQIPKGNLELQLNKLHQSSYDYLFLGFTYLGDGAALVLILVAVLLKNIYKGIMGGVAFIVCTIVTHFCKNFVFPEYDRPVRFFQDLKDIYYIQGLEIHSYHSFPSGHTSAAFCIFSFIAFVGTNKNWGAVLWFMGFLVSISRIYLMQHFFIDTYFGAIVGVASTVMVFIIFENYTHLSAKLGRPLFSKPKDKSSL